MKLADKYIKLIEWSDQDQCFIGSCPELFFGGCHGDDSRAVFDELCQIIEEMIAIYKQEKKQIPPPLSGMEFVNKMQTIAC